MTRPAGGAPSGTPRALVRGAGPVELTRVGVYAREVRASAERVWENVHDWEHLPWLHRGSFSSIECNDSGDWGWRARIGLQPASPSRSIQLELRIEPDEPRYVSRTLEGPGAGSEIWTRVEAAEATGEHATRIEVEFWLPHSGPEGSALEPKDAAAYGKAFIELYTCLWDEDERMMIGREHELARRRASRASGREPLGLGSFADVEARLPLPVEFGGERFRVVLHEGRLVAHSVVCPHWLGPLHDVPVERGRVVCPWHGYAFDVETGRECSGRTARLAAAPRVRVDPDGQVWLLPR
jgi:nitrite reductase/ring-hydroxylating ferredoxin subunit